MEKFDQQIEAAAVAEVASPGENRVHRILVLLLLLVMVVEWILLLLDQRWLSAFLATLISGWFCMATPFFTAGRKSDYLSPTAALRA